MATPNITDEEIQFRKRARRRLVGAIVLVLIVVVVVPWILPADKPQQDTQQIDIRIPAQDASGYAPKVLPAPAPAPAAPAPAAPAAQQTNPVPAEATAAVPAAAPQVAPAPAETPKAEAAPKPEAKGDAKAAPLAAAESFYVQYGAFSEAKNARQKQADLKAKGIATFTEVVKTASGDKIRVRSGPYATREAAQAAQQKAKPLDSKLVVLGGKG